MMFDQFKITELLAKAQEMQQKLQQEQNDLAGKKIEVAVGGGLVKVVVNGKLEILSVKIDKSALKPDDLDILEGLVRSACNEALRQAKELSKSQMSSILSGLTTPPKD